MCVGSEVLHFVVGSEFLVVVGGEVEHLGSCGCCRSSQELLCLLVRVAKWGIAGGLRAFR